MGYVKICLLLVLSSLLKIRNELSQICILFYKVSGHRLKLVLQSLYIAFEFHDLFSGNFWLQIVGHSAPSRPATTRKRARRVYQIALESHDPEIRISGRIFDISCQVQILAHQSVLACPVERFFVCLIFVLDEVKKPLGMLWCWEGLHHLLSHVIDLVQCHKHGSADLVLP